jgi:hypothetical protein
MKTGPSAMPVVLFQSVRIAVLLLAMSLLGACSSGGGLSGPQRATDRYSTQFLESDGRIVTRPSSLAAARAAEEQSWWRGEGVTGAPSIVINLTTQQASFYKGGNLVGVSPVSTGREGYLTPAGNFKVIQKSPNHRSNLYGDYVDEFDNVVVANVGVNRDKRPAGTQFRGARMPYFMRLHGAVGMHAGFLPGFADSHGCIRLPETMAEIFYANAPMGTPVRVTY